MTMRPPPSGGHAGDVAWFLVAGGGTCRGDGGDRTAQESPRRVGRAQLGRLRAGLRRHDLAILDSLSLLHYATSEQIERLHFRNTNAKPPAARRATSRALSRLHDLGALEKLPRRVGGVWGGSAPHLWRLTPIGRRLVDDASDRARQPGLGHLAHELAVADLVVRIQEAERRGLFEVLLVQTQPACWRSYQRAGRSTWLKADLRLTLGLGDDEFHWYVEVDRATEHRPTLRRKVAAYLDAWCDGGARASEGVQPRTLWVVPDNHRATVIAGECMSADRSTPDLFAVATVTRAVHTLVPPR